VFGTKDIFKSMQVLPGLQPGPEGTSQLNVRGGSPDQNLVLIDDMPIYYNTHIYGFLSTFNTNAIKSIKLFKGAVPARYNNFTSAVIDIVMKDGSLKDRTMETNIDMLSLSAAYDGFIKKNKLSATFFVRRSLWDFFLLGFYKLQAGEGYFNYNFVE
jgi:hypothetical protein